VRRGGYWNTVLIHVHRARLSPRVIPGPSQFVALFLCDKAPSRRKAFIVRADEKLTAFVELESALRAPELLL
jgi:hypothetical protein